MPTYTIPQIAATKILPRGDDYFETGGVTDGSAKTLIVNFSQTVTTLAALKALSITNAVDGQCVLSKVGGIFYWDSASSATPNDTTIVQPNAGSGRWLAAPGVFTSVNTTGAIILTGNGGTPAGPSISNNVAGSQLLIAGGTAGVYIQKSDQSGTIAVFSNTGLVVTGALSATGVVTKNATVANGAASFASTFDGGSLEGLDLAESSGISGATFLAFRNSGGTAIGSIARVTTTNAVAFNTTSDLRLKENLRDFTVSGALIDALQPRLFDWVGGDDASKDVLGFIAQEVNAIDPLFARIGAVQIGDDGEEVVKQWAMDHSKLIPLMVAELKSLRSRVAALEAA